MQSLSYSADILGQPDNAILSYKVDFKPTISKFVPQKNAQQGLTVVDIDWRSIVINDPLVIDAPKYGKMTSQLPNWLDSIYTSRFSASIFKFSELR